MAALTLGEFRAVTKDLPDDTPVVPRYVDPGSMSDAEPAVRLLEFKVLGVADGETCPAVGLMIELVDLEDIESGEEEENEDGEAETT